jgi:subtilisin-like proprotein convertase family protein
VVRENQFDIGFNAQTIPGNYSLTLGPDIRDLAGNPMDQNGNGVNGETADRYTAVATLTTTRTFWSADVPKNINDLSQARSFINVTQNLTIERLAVKVTLTHTYVSDLRLWLLSPSGTWVLLFNQRGGNGQNINTTFDDRASTSIAQGSAPYTGWFKPERPLSTLAGQNARGRWTLVIEDLVRNDVGRLTAWNIMIDSGGNGMARIRSDRDLTVGEEEAATWYGNVPTRLEPTGEAPSSVTGPSSATRSSVHRPSEQGFESLPARQNDPQVENCTLSSVDLPLLEIPSRPAPRSTILIDWLGGEI